MSSDTTRHPAEVHQHLGVKARQRRPPGVTRCSIANSDSYLDFSPFRGTPCRPGGTPHKGNSGDGREAFAADPATSRIRAIRGDSPGSACIGPGGRCADAGDFDGGQRSARNHLANPPLLIPPPRRDQRPYDIDQMSQLIRTARPEPPRGAYG